MSKAIELSQGRVALVDDDIFEEINTYKWYYHYGYAVRNYGKYPHRKRLQMHREIIGTPDGFVTDHINGNTLDNRRENLRTCAASGNSRNAGKRIDNTSGFKGVSWHKQAARWRAYIALNGHRKSLGLYDTAEDAAHAYDAACIDLYGDFARPNKGWTNV